MILKVKIGELHPDLIKKYPRTRGRKLKGVMFVHLVRLQANKKISPHKGTKTSDVTQRLNSFAFE